ncbi:hypothetical protein D3C74_78930 [compost metagenome]
MLLEQHQDRHGGLRLVLADFLEDRGLVHRAAHEVADGDQDNRHQERNAPAPFEERIAGGDHPGHQRHGARGQQHAQWHAHLRVGPCAAAVAVGGVLDGHQHRAAPFAASGDALQDAQQQQHDRRPDACGLVGRQHADQRGGCTHQRQGQDQHRTAADLVAEVPGQECAQRAEEEGQADRGEGDQQCDLLACWFEEQLAEDQACCGGVDEEVVPLHGGSDDRRESYAALVGLGGLGLCHSASLASGTEASITGT